MFNSDAIFECHVLNSLQSTHAHRLYSGLHGLSYWIDPQMSDWQTSPLGHWGCAGISDAVMLVFSIFPPQHPSLCINSIHARTNNRLDTSKKKKKKKRERSCLLLAHMEVAQICWWREGAVEACCRAEGQGLIPSWLAPFQPRGTSVLQQSKSWGSHPPPSLHPPTPLPEDDRCSVRSLQQGESIRHLYNWLRMREKKGGKDGRRGRRKTDCEGVCLHLSETLDAECVFLSPCLCVKMKWEILQRQKDMREGKWENRVAGEEGAEGEVGSWHRWDWLSLNRTSFHTHYTCPLQSSHKTSTGAALWKTGPHFRLMELPIFYGGVVQPGQRLLMSSKISQQQNYFKGLTLALPLTIGQGLACDGEG